MHDYEPRPSVKQSVDMLELINSPAVRSIIDNANLMLTDTVLNTNQVAQFIKQCRKDLQLAIGDSYTGGTVTITGMAHTADHSNYPDGTAVPLENRQLIYYSPTIKEFDGVFVVVFEFLDQDEMHDNDDDIDPDAPSYYMRPEEIVSAEIAPIKSLIEIISHHVKQSQEILASQHFLSKSYIRQHVILAKIVAVFDEEIAKYDNRVHRVDTDRFIFLGNAGLSLVDSMVDQSLLGEPKRYMFRGRFIGSVFPEIIDKYNVAFQSINDLELGQGAPCMAFRDDSYGKTYLIPLSAIKEIRVEDGFDS